MKNPLHILYIEDSPRDAELVLAVLEQEGVACDVLRVETRADYVSALEQSRFDLILGDYTMPGFDGLSALKIAREKCADTPFIFVSGTIGEEVAIEAVKHGATDYVLKDRLSRLVTCVRRALREVEEQRELKRAQEALRESEARKKAMLEGALDAIIAIDHQGKILEFNPAAERTFGHTLDQAIGKPLADLIIPPHLRDKHKQGLKQFIATGKSPFIGKVVEATVMRADGTEFPAEIAITSIGQKWPPMFLGHLRDITERKQAEEKMRLQSVALESAANTVVITGRDGIITWVNPAFTQLTGYSPEEAIGRNPRLLKSGTQDQPFYENLWNTILSGQVWSGEIVNRRKDGVLYTEEQTITPVRDAQGDIIHFIAIKQNITERKRAEKERARLISVIEATTDLVGISDPEGRLLYLNKNGRKMLGISEDEDISGFQVSDSHPEPARKLVFEEAIPTAIREGVWQGENSLLTRDGREIPVLQVILAHRAPDGSVEFLSTIIRDITERKQAEKEIQHNLDRIRALHDIDVAITSTLDLRAVLDVLLEKIDLFLPYSAATVRLWNEKTRLLEPVACRNINEEEWKADQWKGGRGSPNAVFETKATVGIRNCQTDARVRDHEFFRKHSLVSYLGVPLIAHDQILGVISFYTKEEHEFTDDEIGFSTTLAGQAAIAIHNAQLYQQMARANKIKDEFLSVMSHELRTPLNVVVGYAGMIKDGLLGEVNPQQEEALRKMIDRTNDQLALVNNILYATVIETENIPVESQPVVLGDFLKQLSSVYENPLNKQLSFNWDCHSPLAVVHTDSAKLKQILQNLIDNALKFTSQGSITISARIRQQGGERLTPTWVEFKVSDTGVGIPKEHLPFVFDKFKQVDSSETRSFGGVGMGLYIAKKFAELLGGTIEVESEAGKGSTFTVTLPCGQ